MNYIRRSVLVFLVVGLTDGHNITAENARLRRVVAANPDNAFSNDINKCLFTAWTTASGNQNAVLNKAVECKGVGGSAVQLCYGTNPRVAAQFAVCYNKNTLTPDFTGHIVRHDIQGNGRDNVWRADIGEFAPNPQAAVVDYEPFGQRGLYENFNNVGHEQYCSKGHLTPNADFTLLADRVMTMITTNIAPQWQLFNGGNWATLEAAVRTYAQNNARDVYVFTGVGGQARNLQGVVIKMNVRVLAPRWYWKAVCDPIAKQSIVFVGENSIGDVSTTPVAGCNGIVQTKRQGVVYCHSWKGASGSNKYNGFKLPPFHDKNCNPSVKGTFMDGLLNGLN